jgi:hypothetical protein
MHARDIYVEVVEAMTGGGRGGVIKDVETNRGESRPRRHPFFGHPPSP